MDLIATVITADVPFMISSRYLTWGRLLGRGPSNYQSLSMHCGVDRSLHARFRGDWPGSFGMIDVTDRQTDR